MEEIYTKGFKTWLENNDKKLLILIHPDCVVEEGEDTMNQYDVLLKNHAGRFDYVITHLFWPKFVIEGSRYSEQIKKILTTVRGVSDEVIERDNERCSYSQSIPDYLINNPGVTVYMAGGYEDNCLWISYAKLFRNLSDILKEGEHQVFWYRPLIFQDSGHGLKGTKQYKTFDSDYVQHQRQWKDSALNRVSLNFHPDMVDYRNENIKEI
jgi:hypothetical protein